MLQMLHEAWSMCQFNNNNNNNNVGHTETYGCCAITAVSIEMPFEVLTDVGQRWDPDLRGNGHFRGGHVLADVTYLRMSVLLFVCLQVHAADECICSLPREVTWRCYCSSHADMSLHLLGCLLPTALARQVKQLASSVCMSVRLSVCFHSIF